MEEIFKNRLLFSLLFSGRRIVWEETKQSVKFLMGDTKSVAGEFSTDNSNTQSNSLHMRLVFEQCFHLKVIHYSCCYHSDCY